MSKVYITRWHCPGCDRQLEYRTSPYIKSFDETVGPLCTECATKLREDTSDHWFPEVIVTFE
jgi:predicted GNAT family acetyltransferase